MNSNSNSNNNNNNNDIPYVIPSLSERMKLAPHLTRALPSLSEQMKFVTELVNTTADDIDSLNTAALLMYSYHQYHYHH